MTGLKVFAITLLTITGIAFFGDRIFSLNSSSSPQLVKAQKRWEKQAVFHYRLNINYSHINCQQQVEIKDEKVIGVRQNTCSTILPQTVTQLFQQIELFADSKKCGPNGCVCDGPIGVNAIYDTQFGYPRQIEISLKPEKRWLYPEYWKSAFTVRACTLVGFVDQKITVSISPINN
jgi:Family of unknown function (DUF6174)